MAHPVLTSLSIRASRVGRPDGPWHHHTLVASPSEQGGQGPHAAGNISCLKKIQHILKQSVLALFVLVSIAGNFAHNSFAFNGTRFDPPIRFLSTHGHIHTHWLSPTCLLTTANQYICHETRDSHPPSAFLLPHHPGDVKP
jgi:hypothetical protein